MPGPPSPVSALVRSLASVGRDRDLLPDAPGGAEAPGGPGARAWVDAAEAVGIVETRGDGRVVRGPRPFSPDPPAGAGKALDPAFRDPLPPPTPGRRRAGGPHPVGGVPPAVVASASGGVPDRVLVWPGRSGRLAGDLVRMGAGSVLAHEPDPALRENLAACASDRVDAGASPATELGYHRRVDAAVADRALQSTRSLVGLLGRLHHALDEGGVLVLHDVLLDESQPADVRRNREARALRVHLRARGRDLVSRQDLWRLLVETGFQGIRFGSLGRGRYVVRARR